jgi:hypothetical protein
VLLPIAPGRGKHTLYHMHRTWKKKGQPSHFSYSSHFDSLPSRHLCDLEQTGRVILQLHGKEVSPSEGALRGRAGCDPYPGLKSMTPAVVGAPLLGSLGFRAFRWKNVTWPAARAAPASAEGCGAAREGRRLARDLARYNNI